MGHREIMMICGCHRSGTSVFTGALSQLYGQLPGSLIGASKWNKKGYFESSRFREFHDEILEEIGRPVFDFRETAPDTDFTELMQARFAEMEALLETEFADAAQPLIKDPRLCRLLPLWRAYVEVTGHDLRVILPIRHPRDVAASLHRRNGFSIPEGELIWLREVTMSVANGQGLPTTLIRFEDFLADWRETLSRAMAEVKLDVPDLQSDGAAAVTDLISPDLRTVTEKLETVSSPGWVSELAAATYAALGTADAAAVLALSRTLIDTATRFAGETCRPGPDALQALWALQPAMTGLAHDIATGGADTDAEGPPKDVIARLLEHTAAQRAERHRLAETDRDLTDARARVADLEEQVLVLTAEMQDAQRQLHDRYEELAELLAEFEEKPGRARPQKIMVSAGNLVQSHFVILTRQRTHADSLMALLRQSPRVFLLGEAFHPVASKFNFYAKLGEAAPLFEVGKLENVAERFFEFCDSSAAEAHQSATHIGMVITYKQMRTLPEAFQEFLLEKLQLLHLVPRNILRFHVADLMRRAADGSGDAKPGAGHGGIDLPCDNILHLLQEHQERIEKYRRILPKTNTLEVAHESLSETPRETLRRISTFLDLEGFEISPDAIPSRPLPVSKILNNYRTIKRALNGTEFEKQLRE